ncbi:hypothetical protein ACFX19_009160 [Malus domestica]
MPTLYTSIDALNWLFLFTEFYPDVDLHVLRQRHLVKRFKELAVRSQWSAGVSSNESTMSKAEVMAVEQDYVGMSSEATSYPVETELELGLSLGDGMKLSNPCAWGEHGRILTANDFPSMVVSTAPLQLCLGSLTDLMLLLLLMFLGLRELLTLLPKRVALLMLLDTVKKMDDSSGSNMDSGIYRDKL